MPLFMHKKDPETGRTWMEQVEVEYSGRKFQITTPQVTPAAQVKIYVCKVCKGEEKKLRSAGVAAMHFRRIHPDLNETKESWKEHFEVKDELARK